MNASREDTMSIETATWRERIAVAVERSDLNIQRVMDKLENVPNREEVRVTVANEIKNHADLCKQIRRRRDNDSGQHALPEIKTKRDIIRALIYGGAIIGSAVAGLLAGGV
jgi:Mg-chelatase subunit ChlI